jgi:hypothetical protein
MALTAHALPDETAHLNAVTFAISDRMITTANVSRNSLDRRIEQGAKV